MTHWLERENLSTSDRSWRAHDLPITNPDALPLSHRTLVKAVATKLSGQRAQDERVFDVTFLCAFVYF